MQQVINAAEGMGQRRYSRNGRPLPPVDPKGTGMLARLAHEIGYIAQLWDGMCGLDPWFAVESGVEAAMHAFFTVLEPDLKEVWHKATGKSAVCTLKTEANDVHEFGSKFDDGLKNFAFTASEVADLAIWRLFLASVSIDGFADWTSQNYIFNACSGSRHYTSTKPFGGTADPTNINDANGFDWDCSAGVFQPTITLQPGHSGFIYWNCSCMAGDGFPVPVISQIYNRNTGFVYREKTSTFDEHGNPRATTQSIRISNAPDATDLLQISLRCWCPFEVVRHIVSPRSGFCAISTLVPI